MLDLAGPHGRVVPPVPRGGIRRIRCRRPPLKPPPTPKSNGEATTQGPHPPLSQEGKENKEFPSPLGRPVAELPAPGAAQPPIRGQGEGPEKLHGEATPTTIGNRSIVSGRWRSFLIVLSVLATDQISKIVVENRMPLGHTIPILPFFSLSHVQNTGAAFGMFADSNGAFIVLTVVILALLAKMHRELAGQGTWAAVGVLLVWGGAVGNLVDRIRTGAVTDFLDFYWRGWHWPAFNVADSAITVGVTLLFVQNLFKK
ncbi:MAG: signal peptidase II [Elusimicrobia bacterium]|nr:signal peptidase II [Elusimicrobiota bacterium]